MTPPNARNPSDADLLARALGRIPGGASTGSKRADAIYGHAAPGPTHFRAARGCRLVTAEGAELVDCTMALGAVALGYADPGVTAAVVEAARAGNTAGLSHVLEVEVAERLCQVIPCAEQVRFLKSGAEAMAAAVRIARTHTGRTLVLGSGYFGWLDWSNDSAGVPEGVRAGFRPLPFDDLDALERAAREAGDHLAAIAIEPVIERLPSREWILAARRLASDRGAVLIFDEMKTGFRLRTGGYQELAGVVPDLAAFGKAMANGFPIAAVVGREPVMRAAARTWISSTLAGEATALAAVRAVLERHEHEPVCTTLAARGAAMRAAFDRAVAASGVEGVRQRGIDPMWLIEFAAADRLDRFVRLAAGEGVLFKRGAYDYASLAHDQDAIERIERAATTACEALGARAEAARGR